MIALLLTAHGLTAAPLPADLSSSARGRVVVVADKPSADAEPTTMHLRAELVALGFEVELEGDAGEAPADERQGLLAIAKRREALAVVRVRRAAAVVTVEVWAADQTMGRMRTRSFGDVLPTPTAKTIALAAVEMLNAAIYDIGLDLPAPAPVAVRAPPPTPAKTPGPAPPDESPVIAVQIGPSLAYLPGGPSPLFGATARVGLHLTDALVVGVVVSGDLTGGEIDRRATSAQVRTALVAPQLTYSPWPRGRWSPCANLGLGGMQIWVTGHAAPPAAGQRESALLAVASVGGGAQLRLTASLALRVTIGMDWLFGKVGVMFVNERVATLRSPAVTGDAGLAWDWP
ncbi:MAG: hypothetical protein HY903_06945 [Deltaproteobacteria bacterium]|nr:hypothetical protein [Deltaproteobacteria bacterium]